MDFLWHIFLEYFIAFPGAIVLWIIKGFKKPFSLILKEDQLLTICISSLIYAITILLITI